jgi:hypothetical protein
MYMLGQRNKYTVSRRLADRAAHLGRITGYSKEGSNFTGRRQHVLAVFIDFHYSSSRRIALL